MNKVAEKSKYLLNIATFLLVFPLAACMSVVFYILNMSNQILFKPNNGLVAKLVNFFTASATKSTGIGKEVEVTDVSRITSGNPRSVSESMQSEDSGRGTESPIATDSSSSSEPGDLEAEAAEIPTEQAADTILINKDAVLIEAEFDLCELFKEYFHERRKPTSRADDEKFNKMLADKLRCGICLLSLNKFCCEKCQNGFCNDCHANIIKPRNTGNDDDAPRDTRVKCPFCRHPQDQFKLIMMPKL